MDSLYEKNLKKNLKKIFPLKNRLFLQKKHENLENFHPFYEDFMKIFDFLKQFFF